MSPLFMDTGYEPNSSGSLSAEESHSNTAGSEREGEGQQVGKRGTKRRDKNRDAARKSRRKQTERADELHEELQCLEQSNSALQKEIATLKKELHLYETALERHKPTCCLRASSSSFSSTSCLLVSPSADCQTGSSPLGKPPQASSCALAAAPSLSTSITSTLGLQTHDCVGSTHLSSSTLAATTTTLASCTGSSAGLFTSSSCVTVPYSASTAPAPHSLFSEDPLPLITTGSTNATPVCTSRVANPVLSRSLTTAAAPQYVQDTIHERSSLAANACFSYSDALDAFLMKPNSLSTAVPLYSHLAAENAGTVVQACPMNVPQLDPGQFSGNPINLSQPCSLLPSTLQDPALQSLSVSPRSNPEPPPASAFALKPSYSRHVTPTSLLSLLTVPSPPNVSQTRSSSFDGPLSQHPLLPPLGDQSLTELLEVNDWILQ